MSQCSVAHPPSFICAVCPERPAVPRPPPMHYNERGELIVYAVVPTPVVPASPLKATPLPVHPTPPPDVMILDEDDDLDLDLKYPDEEPPPPSRSSADANAPNSAPVAKERSPSVEEITPPPPHHQSTAPPPALPTRYPYVGYGRPPAPPAPKALVPRQIVPLPLPPMRTPSRASMDARKVAATLLCPTEGCNGITRTAGKRCLACIHKSWTRMHAVAPSPQPLRLPNTNATKAPKAEKITLKTPRSGVAADVKKAKSDKRVRLLVQVPGSDNPEIVVLDKPGVESVDAPEWSGEGWDSDLSDLSDMTSSDGETVVQAVVEPPRTPFKIRIPARKPAPSPAPPAPPSVAPSPYTTQLPTPTTPTPPPIQITSASAPPPPDPLQRFCTINRCRKPIPPITEYRWKCCTSCRTHYRQYQRDRMQALRSGANGNPKPEASSTQIRPPEERQAWERQEKLRALQASMRPPFLSGQAQLARFPQCFVGGARVCAGSDCEQIMPGAEEYAPHLCAACLRRDPVTAQKRPGRCKNADCGMLITDAYVEECQQCVRRKNPKSVTPLSKAPPPKKRKRITPYPIYQSRDRLIQDFALRFSGFMQAQTYYSMLRADTTSTMFDFSGEFSIVAPSLDVIGRRAVTEAYAHRVKDDVQRACGIEFNPTSWVSVLGNPRGLVTRFACVHVIEMQMQVPPVQRQKTMQGELEVAVLPDDSHRYFAGEKTIVRFRLVG
ncbi:hypothetical protein MKEN_00860300 [Mycena kentingensis (nom. inval.)]|nr:hypothetical protein MKEN_00860300 [Mycena kentingensis (nom. inval.)]